MWRGVALIQVQSGETERAGRSRTPMAAMLGSKQLDGTFKRAHEVRGGRVEGEDDAAVGGEVRGEAVEVSQCDADATCTVWSCPCLWS